MVGGRKRQDSTTRDAKMHESKASELNISYACSMCYPSHLAVQPGCGDATALTWWPSSRRTACLCLGSGCADQLDQMDQGCLNPQSSKCCQILDGPRTIKASGSFHCISSAAFMAAYQSLAHPSDSSLCVSSKDDYGCAVYSLIDIPFRSPPQLT
eukprot:2480926-Amphidinium_carterae.2